MAAGFPKPPQPWKPKTAGSHEPIGYTYEADVHCPACTRERFPTTEGVDSEGNEVGAIAPWDEGDPSGAGTYCGDCGGEIFPPTEEYKEEQARGAEEEAELARNAPDPNQGILFAARKAAYLRQIRATQDDEILFEASIADFTDCPACFGKHSQFDVDRPYCRLCFNTGHVHKDTAAQVERGELKSLFSAESARRTALQHPEEGCTRCACGSKYWDGDTCASCGEKWDGYDYSDSADPRRVRSAQDLVQEDNKSTLPIFGSKTESGAYDYMPGVPAAGHVTGGGSWHPGRAEGCPKCEPDDRLERYRNAYPNDRRTKTSAVSPGYYTVGPNGAPHSGPYRTLSEAEANLNGAAAIEYKSGVEDPEWNALRAKEFPYGLNTVNGSRDHYMHGRQAAERGEEIDADAMSMMTADYQAGYRDGKKSRPKTAADEYATDAGYSPVAPGTYQKIHDNGYRAIVSRHPTEVGRANYSIDYRGEPVMGGNDLAFRDAIDEGNKHREPPDDEFEWTEDMDDPIMGA